MLADDFAVLLEYDAVGIGVDIDWTANGLGHHRVFVVVEADQTRL